MILACKNLNAGVLTSLKLVSILSTIASQTSFSSFLTFYYSPSFFRSLPLLLPAVEDGIFNDSWRIRQSSVELLGDLLFKVHAFELLPFTGCLFLLS